MNDTSELSFGLEILEMCIAHRDTTPELEHDLRQEVLLAIALMKRSMSNMHVLTVSFCLRGNVLSQWRAYARQDGLAIGFRRQHLAALAAQQDFYSGIVHYYFSPSVEHIQDCDRFTPWLARQIEQLLNLLTGLTAAVEAFRLAQEHGDETVPFAAETQRSAVISKWAAVTAAFIKHPAFEEEQEWRCVKVIDETVVIGDSQLSHRISGTKVIPFVRMSITQEGNIDRGIANIVLGPNSDSGAIIHSADFLIHRYRVNGISIAAPFNPLRV